MGDSRGWKAGTYNRQASTLDVWVGHCPIRSHIKPCWCRGKLLKRGKHERRKL